MTPSQPKPLAKGARPAEIAAHVEDLLQAMTLEEKVFAMTGHGFLTQIHASDQRWGAEPYRAGGGCERLGVPAFHFTDGPRGVARGNSTCFPVTMARGATFDVDLERRVGEIMGIEIRAQGCNLSGAVCINLLRHPAWGRAQETYGEDPYHMGEMGAALALGIQTHNVAATVKHFALNSIENARFKVDVRIDERTLREVYLPHFKRVVDAGVATVMSAYNRVNGEYCGQNRTLLTDILRAEWGFKGFVHADWFKGVYEVYGASAGLDVENPEPNVFAKLAEAVTSGAVEPAVVDTACRRIFTTYFNLAAAEDPLADYSMDFVACEAHAATALEVARKAAVLLRNDGVLPLDRRALKKVAIVGRLAKMRNNTGDRGSSTVQSPYIITPYEGLVAALGPDVEVAYADEEDLKAVRAAAEGADAVICVVGNTFTDEGEFISQNFSFRMDNETEHTRPPSQVSRGGDRDHLGLRSEQTAMIRQAHAANPRTVAVIISGSAVIVEPWKAQAAAILQAFYGGMEGGRAIADILLGDVSPSGKLPFTVPAREDELPFFDKNADAIVYGPLHGYTLFDDRGTEPALPFGFGLSYARFGYRALKARVANGAIEASVAVRNDGDVAAEEVVQLYMGFPGKDAVRPPKLLRGFRRVPLGPGETKVVDFKVPLDDLRWWNPATRSWTLERGTHTVMAGGSSRNADLLRTDVEV